MNFYETQMGRRFFEGQLPKLIRALEDIASSLSREATPFTLPAEIPDGASMKKKMCFLVCLFVCCLLYGCGIEAGLWEFPDGKKSVDVQNNCALCGNRGEA